MDASGELAKVVAGMSAEASDRMWKREALFAEVAHALKSAEAVLSGAPDTTGYVLRSVREAIAKLEAR